MKALAMLSDILPTGFECCVLNGTVEPGDEGAVVGAGPIGLAALLTAQFASPAGVILVDLDEHRLAAATTLGATIVVNSKDGKAADEGIMALTGGRGPTWPSWRWASPRRSGSVRRSRRPAATSPT